METKNETTSKAVPDYRMMAISNLAVLLKIALEKLNAPADVLGANEEGDTEAVLAFLEHLPAVQAPAMDLNKYTAEALRTADPAATAEHDLLHAIMGLVTESAELLDVLKKRHAYGKPVDLVNLREEAGDVLWYLPLLCRALGVSLNDVAALNIAKLRARYPAKFTQDAALNRNLDAERAILEGKGTA